MSYTYKKARIYDGKSSVDLVPDIDEDAWYFRKLESQGAKSNRGQIELIRHDKGPISANSVPGSGKTQTVASRLGYLIEVKGVMPENILLITFTKKGAEEMVSRTKKVTGIAAKELKKITSGTFHSVCLGILREYDEDKREVWAGDKPKQIVIKTIMRQHKIETQYKPEEILALISENKNKLIDVASFKPQNNILKNFKFIWEKYEEYKQTKNYIDFDDMLFDTHKLLNENEKILQKLQDRFQYIVVDEYQDTSTVQGKIVQMIGDKNKNVGANGDLDQCIFSYAGAKVENILDFDKTYGGAKTVNLEVNYRSTDTILGLSNDMIKDNKRRILKEAMAVKKSDKYPIFCQPDSSYSEASYVINEIKRRVASGENQYKDFAVLYRNNSHVRCVFEELLVSEIPFVQFGGEENFYENSTVVPLVSMLKLMDSPQDMGLIADILPTMYIKKEKLDTIKRLQKNNPISWPIEYAAHDEIGLKPFQVRQVMGKIEQLKYFAKNNIRPIILVRELRKEYQKYLVGDDEESVTLHQDIIIETLDEFEASIKRFETVAEFIKFISMINMQQKKQKESKKKKDNNEVKLMTIHKSKGLEFPVVFVVGVSEGNLPSTSAQKDCGDILVDPEDMIEEERRLLYVAITRAMDELYISSPLSIRNKEVEPSRFIQKYIGYSSVNNEKSHYDIRMKSFLDSRNYSGKRKFM